MISDMAIKFTDKFIKKVLDLSTVWSLFGATDNAYDFKAYFKHEHGFESLGNQKFSSVPFSLWWWSFVLFDILQAILNGLKRKSEFSRPRATDIS